MDDGGLAPGGGNLSRSRRPPRSPLGGTITTSNDFKAATGIVDFDPETRDVNGKSVTQFSVAVGNNVKIRVTVWPELKLPEGLVKKGLLIGVRGKYTANTKNDTTYHNISAHSVSVGEKVFTKEDAPVVQKSSAASTAEPAF